MVLFKVFDTSMLKSFFWDTIVIVAIMSIPNLFFWILDIFYGDLGRPIFNADYALSALFFIFFRNNRWLFFPVFFFIFVVDSLACVANIFSFFTLLDMFALFQFVDEANITYIFLFVLFIVAMCLIYGFCVFLSKKYTVKKINFYLVMFVLVCCSVVSYLSNQRVMGFWKVQASPIIDTQIGVLVSFSQGTTMAEGINRFFYEAEYLPWEYKTASSYLFESKIMPKKIVFITIESLGVFQDQSLQQVIFRPFEQWVRDGYILAQGKVKFEGPTIRGELRELCQMKSASLNYKNASALNCLPQQMLEKGYNTHSFSVASKSIYHVDKFYSAAGIKNKMFLEDAFFDIGRCYSYPAGCDINIIPKVLKVLERNSTKDFIYWITSNSHYPYDKRDAKDSRLDCSLVDLLKKREQLCNYTRIQYNFFEHLVSAVDESEIRDIAIILVGDHAGTFDRDEDRNLFVPGYVSFLYIYIPPK